MIFSLLLLLLSILPAGLLMLFIYHQDKYQKEPIKPLMKAFFGGMLAIVFTIVTVRIAEYTIGRFPYLSDTVFYDSFIMAGIPEELCKFLVFMIFIWSDKHFDEYFDGIVYAAFISLGFATIENIMYVFSGGFGVGVVRALISVPGHFLFGVIMGYFLSLAKFNKNKSSGYIMSGLLLAMTVHGLFNWMLMFSDRVGNFVGVLIYLLFIGADIMLWRFGLKLIQKHQQNSLMQAQENTETVETDFRQTDWNAGEKQ